MNLSGMFEWLQKELQAVKTPRFHLVEGAVDPRLSDAIIGSKVPLPLSYKEFVLKFGNAKLYRNSRNGYLITIFAGPREISNGGDGAYQIGYHDGASVCIVTRDGRGQIFEIESNAWVNVSEDFENWLEDACTTARRQFGRKVWNDILRGPQPFTESEKRMLENRSMIRWRAIGVNPDGNIKIEVKNGGKSILKAITIGVRSRDGHLNGAVRLDIETIVPGGIGTLDVDCYRDFVTATEVELFELPSPKPEDREYYFEFKGKDRVES